jgi:hypothetical protein
MARQSDKERLEKQRQRQQELREATLAEKRPSRDDVARVALFWMISSMAQKATNDVLDEFQDKIVELLAKQGFDERASDEVFDDLVRKYRNGSWPFRRKVHLLHSDGPDTED